MGKTNPPPAEYTISSGLFPDTQLKFVKSFFYIDLPKGHDIALKSIIPVSGSIETPDGSEIPGTITTITYQADSKTEYPVRPNELYSHPPLNGYPHKVIIVINSGGGGASTVTDMALPD